MASCTSGTPWATRSNSPTPPPNPSPPLRGTPMVRSARPRRPDHPQPRRRSRSPIPGWLSGQTRGGLGTGGPLPKYHPSRALTSPLLSDPNLSVRHECARSQPNPLNRRNKCAGSPVDCTKVHFLGTENSLSGPAMPSWLTAPAAVSRTRRTPTTRASEHLMRPADIRGRRRPVGRVVGSCGSRLARDGGVVVRERLASGCGVACDRCSGLRTRVARPRRVGG